MLFFAWINYRPSLFPFPAVEGGGGISGSYCASLFPLPFPFLPSIVGCYYEGKGGERGDKKVHGYGITKEENIKRNR